MSASHVENPVTLAPAEIRSDSKSAKKKKSKPSGTGAITPTPSVPADGSNGPESKANGVDGSTDNAYVRELQK